MTINSKKYMIPLLIGFLLVSTDSFGEEKPAPLPSATPAKKMIINPDEDVKDYPEYYKKRVLAFRGVIRKEITKDAKINKAIAVLSNEESPYRRDALEFLIELKVERALPTLLKVGEEKDLRADVSFALGELQDPKGIEFLLRCLYDESDNVRGNAALSLRKLTKKEFGYNYIAPEEERKRAARLWENWWNENKATFKITDSTDEERKDAEERWLKYGKPYIEKIKNQ